MRQLILMSVLAVTACGSPNQEVVSEKKEFDGPRWGVGETTANLTDDPVVVEFRIPAGTGNGAWNTRDTMVMTEVGNVLRIFNDDTINHRLHTNGRPCSHGPTIVPGGSFDCVIGRAYDVDTHGGLYDHNVGPSAAFWMAAAEPTDKAGDVLYERDAIGAAITDNSVVNHDFDVAVSGLIDTISVHVRLTHTYIGDLQVKLRAPNGVEVILHNRAGGGTDNLNAVFGDGGAPIAGIEQLFGAEVRGAWRLIVADQASADTGTLDYVKVTVARSFQ